MKKDMKHHRLPGKVLPGRLHPDANLGYGLLFRK